eukprot:3098560-Pyramimonas_sp.AAC.1
MVYRLNWVGRETRAEASGTASSLASRVTHLSVGDAVVLNKMVDHLRQTANVPRIVWRFNMRSLLFATASDCGGEAANSGDEPQQAWQVYAADAALSRGSRARVAPLARRSCRVKRQVPSTLAGA